MVEDWYLIIRRYKFAVCTCTQNVGIKSLRATASLLLAWLLPSVLVSRVNSIDIAMLPTLKFLYRLSYHSPPTVLYTPITLAL
jgi:hypothetical protein